MPSPPVDHPAAPYTYPLPAERIALHPPAQRQDARLLVRSPQGQLRHHRVLDLVGLLPSDTLLVVNHSKVIHARMWARKRTGGRVEVLCLEPVAPSVDHAVSLASGPGVVWRCLLGGKRIQPSDVLTLDGGVTAHVLNRQDAESDVAFQWTDGRCFADILQALGVPPLPPYIKRGAEPQDTQRYQTVYADPAGSVAAPTAGLHFTPQLLEALQAAGVGLCRLTLHVGAGTFRPLQAATLGGHAMHPERFELSAPALAQLCAHHAAGKPVVAVGTTALRTLESLVRCGHAVMRGARPGPLALDVPQWSGCDDGELPSAAEALEALRQHLGPARTAGGVTRLMIAPGVPIRSVTGLMTNFHQPASTLLLLVAALVGHPQWRQMYQVALDEGYRFLSYGDSSLLWAPR